MIQAYCSLCKINLGVLPKLICSKDMACRKCFTNSYLDSDEMLIRMIDEISKTENKNNGVSPLEAYGFPPRGM